MASTLLPRHHRVFAKLPRQEAFPQGRGHGLLLSRSCVMTETVVGETYRLRQKPSVTVVEREEVLKPKLLELAEGYDRENRMSQLWHAVFLHTPESLWVKRASE